MLFFSPGSLYLAGMRRLVCLMVSLLFAWWAWAQDEEVLRAARFLSGASSDEEVDDYWVSQLEARQGRRIRINAAHIRADGILTEYQIASLADYRSSAGDILSWEELALVDGFSAELVAALRPFLSLASDRPPGVADTVRVRASALVRGTLTSIGGKVRVSGSWWRAGGAWRGKDGTFYGEAQFRGHTLLVGDFNARYGQGLAFWSGFSMSSLSTVDAFIRRTPGISPVWSYSSELVHRGAAYTYAGTHWQATAFGGLDGLLGAHGAWQGRHGQVGSTVSYTFGKPGSLAVAVDTRWNWRGWDAAGEVAWKNSAFAGLAAFRGPVGPVKMAFQGRVVPSRFSGKKYGEYALAAGAEYKSEQRRALAGRSGFGSSVPRHQTSLTADAAFLPIPSVAPSRFQLRVYAGWQWQMASAWALDVRFTERYRNYERPRHAFRVDGKFGIGPWSAVSRLEVVQCEKVGVLNYWEGGYKDERTWSAYFRLTGFLIDQWNDRIYVYERDAPGNFSVPAYSGRGGAVSLVGSWKHRFRWITLKAYLRGSWMVRVGRPPTPGLSLQLHCDL